MTKNCYFNYFLLITQLFAFAFDSSKPFELNLASKTLCGKQSKALDKFVNSTQVPSL